MIRWFSLSLGSALWGALVFSAGLSLAFPGDFLKNHLSYAVQKNTQKKVLLHIGEAGYSGFGGIKLEQVSFFDSKPGRRKPGEKESPPRENTLMTSFDKVYLSPQLLPLLGGTLKAELGLELAGGRLDAAFGTSSSSIHLSSSTEDFDLSQHPIELEGDTVGLQGLLGINGDIEFNTDDIKESSGDMAITIENFGLTGGSISGFTLSETQFSEAELKFEVEDGKAKVTKGSFVGDMLEATVEGHITLRKDPMKSRLALKIKVRFDDTLDRLAKIALKDSRDEDGLYHFRGKGTVMKPRWSAERMSRSSASRRSTRATSNDDNDDIGPTRPVKRSTRSSTVSAKDREERREKRKERLKERRERMRKRREDRRARQAEPDPEDYDAIDDDRYEEANVPGNMENDEPMYEDEIEPEYNDYEDPNGPNENMEDLGYIDE